MVSVAQNWCKTMIVEGCLELHVLRFPALRAGGEALTVGLWTTFNEFPCSVSFSAWLLGHDLPASCPFDTYSYSKSIYSSLDGTTTVFVEMSSTHAVAHDFVSAFSVMTLAILPRALRTDG
jgi:hypothetical protein